MHNAISRIELAKLTLDEKIALIGEIWESIAEDVEHTPLTKEQEEEVERRLRAHRANPDAKIPWDAIELEAMNRLKK